MILLHKALLVGALWAGSASASHAAGDEAAPTLAMGRPAALAYLKANDIYAVATNLSNYAIRADVDIVTAFLAAGIDPNDTSFEANTPLVLASTFACASGNRRNLTLDQQLKTIDVLIAGGADVNFVNSSGLGVLVMAAQQCPAVVVKRLISAGAKLDQRSPQGFTPLLMALMVGNIESAQALVDAGARVSAQTLSKMLDLDDKDAEFKALVKKATAAGKS